MVYPVAGMAANLVLGTIYSWSVFRKPLEDFCGWSEFESSLPFSVFLFSFAATMPFGGRMIARHGPQLTAAVGAVLVWAGWVLSSIVFPMRDSLLLTLFFYGVVAGVGVGLYYGVPIAVSSRWFPERRGLAVGLTVLGFGLSPLVTAPLAAHSILQLGVTGAFAVLGTAFGVLLAVLSRLLRFPEAGEVQAAVGVGRPSERDVAPDRMVRTGLFRALWLCYLLGTFGGFIAISLSAKYCIDVIGMTPQAAAAMTGLFAVFNGAGRPFFGYLTDRLSARAAALLSFAILLVASSTMALSESFAAFVASFSALWFVFGGWLAIAPSLTSKFFGLRHLSTNYGIVFTAYGASALLAPPIAAYLRGSLGTYAVPFATTAALSVIGMVLAALWLRPEREGTP
ncbi:MAG: OFA family MFS transporter [Thaumarchaeota archaeon]|nr:OFA family MFS transporter [Candidatus Calditenuaceae archaeon]MDW8043481.1 OFA family MFS transporter [Nitrososphaerota archaeon]